MVTLLLLLGTAALLIGWVWLLIIAFSESVLWGVLILLIPITGFIFLAINWNECKMPGSLMIGGLVLHLLGRGLA